MAPESGLAEGRFVRELMVGRLVMIAFLAVLIGREAFALRWLDGPSQVTVITATAVVTLAWTWFWWRLAAGPDGIAQGVAAVAITGAAIVLVEVNPVGVFPFYYGVIVAGAAYRWRISAVLAAVATAVTIVVWWTTGHDNATSLQVPVITTLLGGASVTVRRYVAAQLELEETRDELRRLATAEARAQMARDLHDRLGQQLTATVMQGELLAMDLENADADAKARRRADLIVSTSRDALALMRDMVTEMREPGVRSEISVAKTLLGAAGIECTTPHSDVALPEGIDGVLGWVVREATTNAMRHSGASRCTISVAMDETDYVLTVADDGKGADAPAVGNGMLHMRERLAAVGGTIKVSTAAETGYTLTATVPVTQ